MGDKCGTTRLDKVGVDWQLKVSIMMLSKDVAALSSHTLPTLASVHRAC